jgi:hypothetical protein
MRKIGLLLATILLFGCSFSKGEPTWRDLVANVLEGTAKGELGEKLAACCIKDLEGFDMEAFSRVPLPSEEYRNTDPRINFPRTTSDLGEAGKVRGGPCSLDVDKDGTAEQLGVVCWQGKTSGVAATWVAHGYGWFLWSAQEQSGLVMQERSPYAEPVCCFYLGLQHVKCECNPCGDQPLDHCDPDGKCELD